jgi:hypothetical protein
MSRPITLAVALLVPLAVRSAEPPDIVKIEEKGTKLTAPVSVLKAQQQVVTETVNVNGKPATRAVTRMVPVMVTESRVLDAEAGEFYTPAGEKLDPKQLGDVLKSGAMLAVSRDGKPLTAEEAKKHKEIVAVLVPKGVPIGKDVPVKNLMDEKPFAAEASVKDGSVVVARPLPTAPPPAKAPRPRPTIRPSGAPPVEAPAPPAETFTLDPKRTQVLRMDGSVVQPSDWAALLAEKTKVIVSPGGQVVPDELRAANKEAVAVVVIKK